MLVVAVMVCDVVCYCCWVCWCVCSLRLSFVFVVDVGGCGGLGVAVGV